MSFVQTRKGLLFPAVESYDRSTTREYGDLSKDMNDKYQRLKASDDDAIKFSNEHFKSILKQVSAVGNTLAWYDVVFLVVDMRLSLRVRICKICQSLRCKLHVISKSTTIIDFFQDMPICHSLS